MIIFRKMKGLFIRAVSQEAFCSKSILNMLLMILLLTAVFTPLSAENLKNITLDDPVYLFLDKGYAKGWINYLPSVKPYTAKRTIEYLKTIENKWKTDPEYFTDSEIAELLSHKERIEGEHFSLLKSETDKFKTEINLAPHASLDTSPDSVGDSVFTPGVELKVDIQAGERLYLGLSTDSYLAFETWEEAPYKKFDDPAKPDFNMYTVNLATGGTSFNPDADRSPGDPELSIRMNQLNQTTIDTGLAIITFGRDSISWGPSQYANLALSSTASPYEYLAFDIPVGEKIYFSWITGFLTQTDENGDRLGDKLITGHRLEYQINDWFMFSFFETVVYSERFELAYLNPFSLYYISEVNQGDLDNKMGGFDFQFRFAESNLYLSLFVDDWDFGQLFNPAYYHNEMGVTLGYRSYSLLEGLTFTTEYTYLNQWVYTHKEVDGNINSYTQAGVSLGHTLPPNAHMLSFDFRYDADIKRTHGISFRFIQDAYGDIFTHASDDGVGWEMGGLYEDGVKNYKFLDFGVDGAVCETTFDSTLYTEYRIPFYGVKLNAALTVEYTHNKDQNEGDHEWNSILSLSGKWQAY